MNGNAEACKKKSHDSPFQFSFTVLKIEITSLVSYVEMVLLLGWLVGCFYNEGRIGYKKNSAFCLTEETSKLL